MGNIGKKRPSNIVEGKYVAGEAISALKAVRLGDEDTVFLGDPTMFDRSIIVGVALNGAATGQDVKIQNYGVLEDSSFAFANGELLFLNTLGTITNVQPGTGHRTKIGHGLGPGAIFIDIQEPIVLN